MSFNQDSFDDPIMFNEGPTTLVKRLGYVRQLVFSKTRLEFRLLWNKIFQKEDEELSWLLNPYRQGGAKTDATMMSSFNKNNNASKSYQYDFDDVSNTFGRERITIHSRGLARKNDSRRKKRDHNRTLSEKAIDIARYMGMGVYMTSTSFPSPFFPVNDARLYEDNSYGQHHTYAMSRIW